MSQVTRKRVRAFSYFGLGLSIAILAISLATAWLLRDEGIVFALAVATISLQVIINDLFWRAQKAIAESSETLLYCQLSSLDLHTWREPLLTIQSLVSNGMLVLIWVSLHGGGIWLALRNGVNRGYLSIVMLCGSVLSASWIGWILAGRRCLNDDEIIITESACLAAGRLDRWDLPDWHLLTAEMQSSSAITGSTLFLRIWREGPFQQLIERRIHLPAHFAEQGEEACLRLQNFIQKSSDTVRIRRVSQSREKAAKKREQHYLEQVTTPLRVSQLGDLIVLLYATALAAFNQWVLSKPQYNLGSQGHSFDEWHLLPIALTLGGLTLIDILFNIRRNNRFRAGLDEDPLLLFRLPSLWLECHLPEALYVARRELFNDGLLLVIGTLFTGLAFNLHRPELFHFFLEQEIGLMILLLVIVFLVFVVYRDWALRRRLGLVQLSRKGLWLYDKQYTWDGVETILKSCSIEPAPTRSFESARLQLCLEQKGKGMTTLQVPLDKASAAKVEEMLEEKLLSL